MHRQPGTFLASVQLLNSPPGAMPSSLVERLTWTAAASNPSPLHCTLAAIISKLLSSQGSSPPQVWFPHPAGVCFCLCLQSSTITISGCTPGVTKDTSSQLSLEVSSTNEDRTLATKLWQTPAPGISAGEVRITILSSWLAGLGPPGWCSGIVLNINNLQY